MRIPLLGCGILLGATGCSVHPLPDDFPRASTVAIVQQIRCEAYDAVERLRRDNKAVYERENLKDAAIGYRFHFTITETNAAGAGAGFRLPLTHGTFSLGIDAGSEKERVGEREFTVVENFKDITCDKGHRATSENFRYPITGKIGLEETISTFATLAGLKLIRRQEEKNGDGAGGAREEREKGGGSGSGRQRGKKSKDKKNGDKKNGAKTAEFTDSLTFTTTITGGLNPKIELSPLGSGFKLTEAEATLAGERTDKHEVVVALELPRKKDERRGRQRGPAAYFGIPDTGMTDEEYARMMALEALDRQRTLTNERRILERLR